MPDHQRNGPASAAAQRRSRRGRARRPAGMEPRRPLSRHGCAGAEARPRQGRRRRASPSRRAGRASSPPRPRKGATAGLGRCLREYEALEELIGRIVSYAGLVYAGNTTDPQRAKLYGDIQEKMTDASAHLLFFALELNLVDDALIGAALDADPGFGHYRPWVLDLGWTSPTSSKTASSSCSTKSRSPGAAPGTACSTRRWPTCASTSTASS